MASDKEKEVLARQRALAAKISGVTVPKQPELSSTSSSQQQVLLAQANQRKKLEAILTPSSTKKIIRPTTKRPTLKTKATINKNPTNAAGVLLVARQRLGIPKSSDEGNKKSITENKSSHSIPSKQQNKPKSHGLASILSRSTGVDPTTLHQKVRNYPAIEPDDYWKNVRSWNFLADYNEYNSKSNVSNNKQSDKKEDNNKNKKSIKRGYSDVTNSCNGDDDSDLQYNEVIDMTKSSKKVINTPKPIPDTFESFGEYQNLWSPLCLSENRAQLLSEYISYKKSVVPVDVSPWKKKNQENSNIIDYMTVVLQCKDDQGGEYSHMSFMPNDICVLLPDEDCLKFARKGQLAKYHESKRNGESEDCQYCIVGHTEYYRKSCDGLLLKISRKLYWSHQSNNHSKKMFMIKLGCNITALREFTALCRIGTIPLLPYVLCTGKKKPCVVEIDGTLPKRDMSSITKKSDQNKETIEQALQSMGGSKGLGKGFINYAKKKFNPSQMEAIAAAAKEYGDGGFTLVKGPPGTGKTTTLVALLNSLHIRQFNKYYEEVRKVASSVTVGTNKNALIQAAKSKPRLLVCAPSNAAVDNIIMKIMESGFVDGNGCRYNPSMVRVGVGQSVAVKDVALEVKVDHLLEDSNDVKTVDNAVLGYKAELGRIQHDIFRFRRRIHAIKNASQWPLSREWEIRINEDANFDDHHNQTNVPLVFFVNHKEKRTCFEVPPPPEPGEQLYPPTAMPEYRSYMAKIVKLVERYNSITSKIERCSILQSAKQVGQSNTRQRLESHILDATHIVLTTLGTAGNRSLESATKFEVIVIDEAAQSVEPAILTALQLGSSHAILVGDPQQLPATIFSVSGKTTKYDRSLFQRLEEAGHEVHLLNKQYRMHPAISDFPRSIFYEGLLHDGSNVQHPEYGNPLKRSIYSKFPAFQPLTVLDLDSHEERGGTSLSNSSEARLALHLYCSLSKETQNMSSQSRVAIITPYSQQASLLRRTFSQEFGEEYEKKVEINTVDAFQGREANIVIFSCVRAAGSHGIGFLSDVRRMNVGLTRAKFFLFIIARCRSIIVSPYWRDLVNHARDTKAVIRVPMGGRMNSFPDLTTLKALPPAKHVSTSANKKLKHADKSQDDEVK